MTIAIRPAAADDMEALRQLHTIAFDNRPNEARLVELLHAAGKAVVSLVAAAGGQVIGHVLFSDVTLTPNDPAFLAVGLAPLAVLPAYQRQGIGATLVRAGLDASRAAGYHAAVVLGEPRYYGRFGFVRASDFGLRNEYGADNAFMVTSLGESQLPIFSGTVRYAQEFWATAC